MLDLMKISRYERDSYRLSMNDIELQTLDIKENKYIINAKRKRDIFVKMSDVLKLYSLEKEYEQENLSTRGVYRPNLALKVESANESHIIVYNLSIFINENLDLVIPEGVSVISCDTPITCRYVRLPKSLSSILNMKIKCEGVLNLKNVRYISNLSVNAKELILPYTLERIGNKGLNLYGRTIIKSEKTPIDEKIIIGSLGEYSIIDNRDKKSPVYLSNRFCNIYNNSLSNNISLFRELDIDTYRDIDSMFIRNYYPNFLYRVVNDIK